LNPVLTTPPTSDSAQILRYRDRQYAADLIGAAILHFDLFTWFRDHPGASLGEVCAHFGWTERPAGVLLTLCRANGFLTKENQLTAVAREHLVRDSPWYLGPYYEPIRDSPILQGFLTVLRTGKPANWQAKAEGDDWHASMLSDEFARGFTALMNCRGLALGQMLARTLTAELADRKRLLDVGGGSGIYASTLVAAHPHLSATILEQPPVDRIAREEVARHGLTDRIDVVAGDMFTDPWPRGMDTILLSNVLHDWDVPEVKALLRKAADALDAGGLLIVHEAFIADDQTGPLPVAEYSALLANITQGKCYSAAEYRELLSPLGFDCGAYRDTYADRGCLTAIKRATF
jgi:predicted O-methyltransferase YrrM